MRKHNGIDEEMKNEKARSRAIHRVFLAIDVLFMIAILCIIYSILPKSWIITADARHNRDLLFCLLSSLEVIFSAFLVFSAFYIGKWVTKSTNKKRNYCLITWHVINLSILSVMLAI